MVNSEEPINKLAEAIIDYQTQIENVLAIALHKFTSKYNVILSKNGESIGYLYVCVQTNTDSKNLLDLQFYGGKLVCNLNFLSDFLVPQ